MLKKSIMIALLLLPLLSGPAAETASARKEPDALIIELTARREVYTRNIGNGLVLRVTKEHSVREKHFGWSVAVHRKPIGRKSRNLVYRNATGTTADLSQVYAWQTGGTEFPDSRVLPVEGHPVTVRIELIDPVTKGEGPAAAFVSGRLKITWQTEDEE